MARKNPKRETHIPLDVTGLGGRKRSRPMSRDERIERDMRQRAARERKAIDWSVCIVPGCGESLITWGGLIHDDPERRDPRTELPICHRHAAVVWKSLVDFHVGRGAFIEAIADVNDALAERAKAKAEGDKKAFLERTDGDIYFIRLNDMIKVGWTRDLRGRVRAYGASAELLAYYPATRDDETALHRQLRPALAKGREWYHDGPILNRFIADAVEKHGEPKPIDLGWTEPKETVGGKRTAGSDVGSREVSEMLRPYVKNSA